MSTGAGTLTDNQPRGFLISRPPETTPHNPNDQPLPGPAGLPPAPFPRKMVTMPRLTSALPWIIALIGLAVPLVGGGGAGWPYVVGWLIVLGALFVTKPIRHADRQDRIKWALIAAVLSVVPGLVFGGIYLLPAVLTWLLIELLGPPSTAAS